MLTFPLLISAIETTHSQPMFGDSTCLKISTTSQNEPCFQLAATTFSWIWNVLIYAFQFSLVLTRKPILVQLNSIIYLMFCFKRVFIFLTQAIYHLVYARMFQAAISLCQLLFFDHFWYSGVFGYGKLESDGIIKF